ncbi:hypothetical protein DB32_000763 [Sandaracinus amylolyticus]|uniref:Uncharacterized protein n=1 Tax=Sandaracinus amylolyticus TaxID=927083 RepID=A0A0F6SDK7_9BACT|nr:hypothetical protein DB32_000763 [Sandaracinus amylolyticus]
MEHHEGPHHRDTAAPALGHTSPSRKRIGSFDTDSDAGRKAIRHDDAPRRRGPEGSTGAREV